ncbi:MAG: HD domain-containing protein [Candidatus Doudnabacteria bacterium]|nr:HD domain-containing protein [Candidatus Doudnabacteria bacterium]
MALERDIEFLYEIATMRNIQRGWRQHLGTDCANVLDHTIRVQWLALILARMEGGANEEKVLKMALVHDAPETRTSDLSYVQKVYADEKEDKAAHDMFEGTSMPDFYSDILKEYHERQSLEAKVVKDADNLDVDFELYELAERGSKLPEKWKSHRQLIRDEKLYTDSAKKIWDNLNKVDVGQWHLNANKWLHIPEAGL